VLDMGDPVRIADLAKRMIELSGYSAQDASNPNGDIEIRITGLRTGEKLYEELLIGDNPEASGHAKILKANESFLPLADLQKYLVHMSTCLQSNNIPELRHLLLKLVDGYVADSNIVDWLHQNTDLNQYNRAV
jgi:FlaA1/EpsC-like NDP-sugar epimerase